MSMPSDENEGGSYWGRLTDGQSAGGVDASVRLGATGIEVTPSSGGETVLWPYASLSAAEPIRPRSIDVLLSTSIADGRTLFVPSPKFALALLPHAPQVGARAERWRNVRPWLAVTAAIIALIGVIYALDLSPARSIATFLPDSWRKTLGTAVVKSMVAGKQECIAPGGREALEAMSKRLSNANLGHNFEVKVYDWSLVNAFAAPGGKIVLTRGLIEKADGPDEVAGVLSHEMGHAIKLHPESSVIRAIGFTAAIEIMTGGSSGSIANLGVLLAQLGYSRAAEREADDQGLALLKDAKVSPKGLGQFFQRVMKDDGEKSEPEKKFKAVSLFRTHPPTADRLALIERQGAYEVTPSLSRSDWVMLKAICSQLDGPVQKPS